MTMVRVIENIGEAHRRADFLCHLGKADQRRPLGFLSNFAAHRDACRPGWPALRAENINIICDGALSRTCPFATKHTKITDITNGVFNSTMSVGFPDISAAGSRRDGVRTRPVAGYSVPRVFPLFPRDPRQRARLTTGGKLIPYHGLCEGIRRSSWRRSAPFGIPLVRWFVRRGLLDARRVRRTFCIPLGGVLVWRRLR